MSHCAFLVFVVGDAFVFAFFHRIANNNVAQLVRGKYYYLLIRGAHNRTSCIPCGLYESIIAEQNQLRLKETKMKLEKCHSWKKKKSKL